MNLHIRTICLPLPLHIGSVNCYLLENEAGFFLIDTAISMNRQKLERELLGAGCSPGRLKLIILTHGDFDHAGNVAYLREKFGVKIAMHRGDLGMVEQGKMFWNRNRSSSFLGAIAPHLFGFGIPERSKPDIFLEDGDDLLDYGLVARVVSIPGHSLGSIGILTPGGDLFCGDLLDNNKKPALNSIMDDPAAASNSMEKLQRLNVQTVYPGHGRPFGWDLFIDQLR